jgi:IclR family transcriptional regulator, pca regulon regulatory protein
LVLKVSPLVFLDRNLCALRTIVRHVNTRAERPNPSTTQITDAPFIQSLERGLAVIRSFDRQHPRQTVSDCARLTGLTRASARRFLLTLESLAYVRFDGKHFELTPKVLDLGYAYLSSSAIADVALPYMEALSAELHESVSVAVLDGADIVYVARVPVERIMTISLSIGSRLPALLTSMGRALLGDLDESALRAFVRDHPVTARSDRTTTQPAALIRIVREGARVGWVLTDQELENGVRSVATKLRDAHGRPLGAINVSTHAGRVTLADMRSRIIPALLATAAQINSQFARS